VTEQLVTLLYNKCQKLGRGAKASERLLAGRACILFGLDLV